MSSYTNLLQTVFVENISDGTWLKPGNNLQCYKENEAAFVFWDAVPEAEYRTSRSIETFGERNGIIIMMAHIERNLVL